MKNPIRLNALAVGLGGIWLLLAQAASAQEFVPTRMSYQGRVTAGGTNFNGTGWFKFALVSQYGDTAYWSNDGTSMGGEEPADPVEIAVADGLFTVMLGDTSIPNMVEMLPEILDWRNDAHLRIWFSEDGIAFSQLSPDQPAGSTLYALLAARVPSGAVGNAQLASGAVTVSKIANLSVTGAKIENSTITSNKIDWSTMPALSLNGYAESGSFSIKPVAARADSIAMGSGCIASDNYAVVSGGQGNRALASHATVGGGERNQASNTYATVGGGQLNLAHGAYSAVGGGSQNEASGSRSAILGGLYNRALGSYSSIGGGWDNYANESNSVVSGGRKNRADANYASIGGGLDNTAYSTNTVVAGGMKNTASEPFSSVGGGQSNAANAVGATVAGGVRNTAGGHTATVGGGERNTAGAGSATIGGGTNNQANGTFATVGGGKQNIADGDAATVGGGEGNRALALDATVAGGWTNTASGSSSFVGGGDRNIAEATASVVGGGTLNAAKYDFAFVGGGWGNAALGRYATIPGGYTNSATAYSFAAGYRAKAIHTGSFVWSDMRYADFSSTRSNQFAVRAGGGVWIQADSSGLNPAACRIESTTANGVGLQITQTSSDANLVLSNPGSGDHVKAYSGAGTATLVFRVANNGSVTALSFNPTSDRNAKDDFQAVDPRDILEKVLALPITTWTFKAQDPSIRHIGPMAQDFYAAFGVGESDTAIATIDTDGVALAAIQGLAAEVGEQRSEIDRLQEENADLRDRLERLEALIAAML